MTEVTVPSQSTHTPKINDCSDRQASQPHTPQINDWSDCCIIFHFFSQNQSQEKYRLEAQPTEPVSLTFHSALRKLYIKPSIGASYQILVHLATRFQRRRLFRNRPTRNKNCLWPPCLLTNRAKMSNLYKGPSIDASYQVSIHLWKWFQRRRFLEIDQPETRIACGNHVC